MITVRFTYLTGLQRHIFRNPRLRGSWDASGRYSDHWTDSPMQEIVAADGSPAFTATVDIDDNEAGKTFRWGVVLDGPMGANVWGITTETAHLDSQRRYREFQLAPNPSEQRFYLTHSRWLGAQKFYADPAQPPAIRFAVWAPNAQQVEVVFGRRGHGYIADDGDGIDPAMPVVPLARGAGGVWESQPVPDFASFVGAPYMFRIRNAQGETTYRTDLHSRWQIGRGQKNPQNPEHGVWNGDYRDLDGSVSCSVVVDQDVVRKEFEPPAGSPPEQIDDDEFWTHEFTPGLPLPTRIDDLVIYELHIGSLGFGHDGPGTLADAMELLDYLSDLGVNAVELLPVSEYSGWLSWGYGNTHHFVIESSAGGRDKFKHFVRECHRRGMAVIQDVVYNHHDHHATRAQWEYDSTLPEENIYYWYEGKSSDYADPDGGYLNNESSAWAPRYREEPVRQLFISSAAEFVEEFHVDGLRVDLTQAIHRDNTLNADGSSVAEANLFGQKLLREWSRTLHLLRPSVFLIAEDHTGWEAVTRSPDVGGLGFESTWSADFYHSLIGDSKMAGDRARLLREAGFGHDGPLPIGRFAGALRHTRSDKVVYHESHDEAGNSEGTLRTSRVAVNDARLVGATREYAEARSRVVAGLSMLSAGTPMFLMGEEVFAQKLYLHDEIPEGKEDLHGERAGDGARMFRFYQDLIRLVHAHPAIRSRELDIFHALDSTRVLAFTRLHGENELLVVASLNNHAYANGYVLRTEPHRLPAGWWQEIFNSDSELYGGRNTGNFGASIPADHGRIGLRVPANGFVVLHRR
jgi:1,4-alpha-glucan branching enzyme